MNQTPLSESNALAGVYDFPTLIRFALPTMVMMVSLGLYTIGDTVLVARFVNTEALSAINIVCPVINVIVGLGAMLATGSSAAIARNMGAGDGKRAQQDFTLIILVGAALGLAIAVAGIACIKPIIRGLGASDILYPYCRDYLLVLLLFTPASMLQMLFQNLMVTAGRPGLGLVLSLVAGATNVALDWFFMVHLHMGIAGSALGTGIGYLIPTVVGLVFFSRTTGSLRFRKPVVDFRFLGGSCFNGSSEMVGQLATAVTTFLFNMAMMRLAGESGVAAITIIIYSQFLLASFLIGFSMGVAPVLSYTFGSADHVQLSRLFRLCLGVIGICSITVFVLSMVFGSQMVGVFSSRGTLVHSLARKGFLIFPFSFLFSGINIFASAAFTALSNGKISAIISFSRTFGFITAALLVLPVFFGMTGVWLAIPLAEFLTFFLSVGCILRYRNRYHYLLPGRQTKRSTDRS